LFSERFLITILMMRELIPFSARLFIELSWAMQYPAQKSNCYTN
jgi:hypothetical protein